MPQRGRTIALLLLVHACLGCAFTADRAAPGESPALPVGREVRTLVAVAYAEPAYLTAKPLFQGGISIGNSTRLFNAGLVVVDDRGNGRAYLAESVPELNTDTWRVLPDGRMETT